MSRDLPYRKSIRLKNYDYSQQGGYFVTICTQFRLCLYGEVVDGKMILNDFGSIVEQTWINLPNHYVNLELSTYIVMPNHFHAILILHDINPRRGGFQTRPSAPDNRPSAKPPKQHALPEIVRAFKTFSAKRINAVRKQSETLWQRNYFERIIRDESEYERITDYINLNPQKWNDDSENPNKKSILQI